MKKTFTMILALAFTLVLFAGCSVSASGFDVEFGPMQYGEGTDKVHVTISCDYSSVNVRSARCWWTFDGSNPVDETENKNFKDDEEGKSEFDIVIPLDFYEGQIKMLCEIEYKEGLQIKKVSKSVTKSFSTKYHSIKWPPMNLKLTKGKGYQKSYTLGLGTNHDVISFDVEERGTLKVIFLDHPEYFSVDNHAIDPAELVDNTYRKENVSDSSYIDMYYTYSGFVASGSPDLGKKTGEYLIIME